jgi:hypothetical protein
VGVALTAAIVLALTAAGVSPAAGLRFTPENLNGAGNNRAHPSWGQAGTRYLRLTAPRYANGIGQMVSGPNPRYVSDRIFNSLGVDLFSARYVSQWGWVWGQFLDHTFGLAEAGRQSAPISFNAADPLEGYRSNSATMAFTRDAVAPGSGTSRRDPRAQINTVASYIDASAVYGESRARLDWLLKGPDDGRLADSTPQLMLPGGYLPTARARSAARRAPYMQTPGPLTSDPGQAYVAGDVRANDNAELTAVQTLFAREHNRIVAALPRTLPATERFQIARRVVAAEQQYITYTEFLPAMGVRLSRYRGYRPQVNPQLSAEFATIGYRAHSMVNGEEHIVVAANHYSPLALGRLQGLGVGIRQLGRGPNARLRLTLSQGDAFFHPAAPQTNFTEVTGERTASFPTSLASADPINDPHILDVLSLRDVFGRPIKPGSGTRAVFERQRTTLAARLEAIYGTVGRLDAFVGMLAEPHIPGTEFGSVQLALWRRQFAALRYGDRFFYARDAVLAQIQRRYGITYRHTLGQLISLDAGVPSASLPRDVFFAPLPRRQ